MLRIDPGHPPLWRSPDCLQFGRDGSVRIDEPSLWQLRLIRELEKGIAPIALTSLARSLGVVDHEAAAFVELIRPVLARAEARAQRVGLVLTDDASAPHGDAIAHGLAALNIETIPMAAGTDASHRITLDAVVLVAGHALHPRQAADLQGRDIPHLPILLCTESAEVGPLVIPGRSACLQCVYAHQRDRDPLWPVLTAQLVGRGGPVGPRALAVESGLHAGRMLSAGSAQRSLRLSVRVPEPVHQRWEKHPECWCGSPEGSGTATGPATRQTTTETEFAVPA